MNIRFCKSSLLLLACAFGLAPVGAQTSPPKPTLALSGGQPGQVVAGVRLSLSLAPSEQKNVPAFLVTFSNEGPTDVVLSLGYVLGNGRVQLPDAMRLLVSDAKGQTRELAFSDRHHAGIRGRVDEYRVPLRAGSSFSLRLGLDKFVSTRPFEFGEQLAPGRYGAIAVFEGVSDKTRNWGRKGLSLKNYWRGEVKSNALPFTR